MGYYAAGGYYQAGGFFSSIGAALHRFSGWVAKTPIVGAAIGLIPGASSVLSGINVASNVADSVSVGAAHQASTAGTPGHNAAVAMNTTTVGRRRRQRLVRRRRRWTS